MYKLTLTKEERKAIDWVGGRYATGDEFADILTSCCESNREEWNEEMDITFSIPEYKAWEIKFLFEQEGLLFPCFAKELSEKLFTFYYEII